MNPSPPGLELCVLVRRFQDVGNYIGKVTLDSLDGKVDSLEKALEEQHERQKALLNRSKQGKKLLWRPRKR